VFQLRDQVIENQTIELAGKDYQYLGHNLILIGCRVVIRVSASALTVAKTKFLDCDIEVKRKLNNFRWFSAYLEDCRFTGMLRGCDFGHWPEMHAVAEDGGIKNCDFRGATLDGCRFIGCDPASLQFPRWPCFTILHPGRRKEELASIRWPGQLAPVMSVDWTPPITTALTYSAAAIVKKYGAGTSEAELRTVIETMVDVIY